VSAAQLWNPPDATSATDPAGGTVVVDVVDVDVVDVDVVDVDVVDVDVVDVDVLVVDVVVVPGPGTHPAVAIATAIPTACTRAAAGFPKRIVI
jgi:hypothetical protein